MARGGGDLRAGGGVVALGVGDVPVGAGPLEVVTLIITVLLTYQLITKIHVSNNHGVATTQLQAQVMPLNARIEMQAEGRPTTTDIRQRKRPAGAFELESDCIALYISCEPSEKCRRNPGPSDDCEEGDADQESPTQ